MEKCICGAEKSRRMEKCHKCTMQDKIKKAVPGITNEELKKMEIVIHDYIHEAWSAGAWEAANDMGSRM